LYFVYKKIRASIYEMITNLAENIKTEPELAAAREDEVELPRGENVFILC